MNNICKKFQEAGSEQNLKNLFNQEFFNGNAVFEQDKIDLIADHITFESKYKDNKATIPDMFAQLIATHQLHNIPYEKYIGVFNENEISFMKSESIEKRIRNTDDINWKEITPSKIKNDINLREKIIQNIIPNEFTTYDFNKDLEKIKNLLKNIELNQEIKVREEILEEELRRVLDNLNKEFNNIKSLQDTNRCLFFSAIMIAINESYPLHIIGAQRIIYEEKIKECNIKEKEEKTIEYNREAILNISNAIIETVNKLIKSKINTTSKEKWKDQFIFIRNLDIDIYKYIEIINMINNKIFKSFKIGQKQDILGKAYKIFLSRAGKVDNKNIIITPDHIKSLMVKLAQLNKNDVILDTCMGTGGFLMEAMETMEKLPNITKNDINNIHEKQLIGSEIDPKLFVLACSNMFLHGDGRSQLYDKDSLNDDITFKENNCKSFFDYIKSLKPTKCIINPPYENNYCFEFTKQALDFLENNGKLIIIIKDNTFQNINNDIEKLLKNNTLDFYIKMPSDLFSEQNRSVSTAIFGFTKGIPHSYTKNIKFYNLSDDGFIIIPHNGRLDINNNWLHKQQEIIDYIINDKNIDDKNITYKEKIFDESNKLKPIYHKFIEKSEPLCEEDFEEAIFDYFLYENDLGGHKLKKLVIETLKNL